jgi:AcrR family transcriptional regulator
MTRYSDRPMPRNHQTSQTSPSRSKGARKPTQARSRDRFERILAATEALLETHPIDEISVGTVSDQSGINRATVYQFFPTVRSILHTLGTRFLDELYDTMVGEVQSRGPAFWRETIAKVQDTVVRFYSRHPAACSLFLGDGSLHGLRVIDQDFDKRFIEHIRWLLGASKAIQPTQDGDPIQIVVTISISILSLSVYTHQRITDYYNSAAKEAITLYLATLFPSDRAP